jgi:hypothetical protein
MEVILVSASEMVFNFLSISFYRCFGKNKLRSYEKICINAWKKTLDEESQIKLKQQLKKIDLVQRQANELKTVFYCVKDPECKSWNESFLFSIRDENLKVFSGELTGEIKNVKESVKFSIFLHKGRLSSIEFDSELGVLKSLKDGLVIESGNINKGAI